MPLITGTIGRDGATVSVLIGVSQNRRKRLVGVGLPVPEEVALQLQIDTGSHVTGIPPGVFEQLGIQPFRTIAVRTPSTSGAPDLS